MVLRDYVTPLLKWWWLLVAATLLAAGSSYLAAQKQPAIYQTHATLMIGTVIQDPNPNFVDLPLAQQLAGSYADIGNREPLKLKTMQALGLSFLPDTLVRALANSNLIDVGVTDTDPQRAQVVANELANQLILISPGAAKSEDANRQQFVNEQLNSIQAQIHETDAEIQMLQQQLGDLNSASQIADIQVQITAQQNKLNALQANFASLLLTTQKGATNTLSLVELAPLPTTPIGPNKSLIVGLAAGIGLALAALAAYGMEALDDTVRSDDDVNHFVNAPILAHIGEMSQNSTGGIYVTDHPLSTVAEGFRSLRTNLEFAGVDRPLKTLLITSASPGDGKTLVASNLAVMMAKGGKRVILLDADLRKPGIHESFRLSNSKGLSDVFLGSLNVENAINAWEEDNLGVITAGPLPPNPAELVSSDKMDDIMASLQERADVVVVDAVPFLLADAWVLAAKVDAVLLVVRPGHTRKRAVRAMMEQLNRSGARVVGVALNRIRRSPQQYNVGSMASYYARARPGKSNVLSTERANVKRAQSSLELLNAIGRILAADRSLRDVWKSILQLVMERMGASGGGILLLDELGKVIDGAVAYKGKVYTSVERGLTDTAARGLAGWVIEHRQGAVVPNTLDDPRWLRRSWEERDGSPRSAISVPLITLNRVVGVLTLTHTPGGHFTNDDLALLTAVSGMISVIGVPGSEAVPASSSTDLSPAGTPPEAPGPNGQKGEEVGVKDPD
jgi:succinoglycan biosynthesis transport protein ExoP